MMNKGFSRAKIDSLTLGERLEKLRESQQFTIEELSKNIKIRQSYIRALELGDYKTLPTKVYVQGFIKAYARYFNVSEEKLVNLFNREYRIYKNIRKENDDQVEDITRLPALPKLVLTSKMIIFLAVSFIVALASLYLFFGFKKFVSAPWLRIEEPVNGTITKEQEITIKGMTKNDARVYINDQLIQVDLSGSFSDQVGLLPGLNKITVKSINKFDKESVETITVEAQYSEVSPEDYQDDEAENKVSLKVKAVEKTLLLKVVVDNVLVYDDALKVDEEQKFFAEEKIEVSSSDGKNTLVNFNDAEEFTSLSNRNREIKDVVFEVEKDEAGENKEGIENDSSENSVEDEREEEGN